MNPKRLPAGFSKECLLGLRAVKAAGEKILEVYNTNFSFEIKKDGGPVTTADLLSQKAIKEVLDSSGYYILSEEGIVDKPKSRNGKMWIVDPLDGTSDFINKMGEFAVLIGLVENGVPCLGIIHQPVTGLYWVAEKGNGAYQSSGGSWEKMSVSEIASFERTRAVMSRHHLSGTEKDFLRHLGIKKFLQKGSCGLKAVEIACGNAGLYFTFTDKINQWDTCAANCLIAEAGGQMTDMQGNDLIYGVEKFNHPNGILVTNGILHEQIIQERRSFIEK